MRLNAQMDLVEKRVTKTYASQIKFTMDMVGEMSKMLQVEVDRKIATAQADLLQKINQTRQQLEETL